MLITAIIHFSIKYNKAGGEMYVHRLLAKLTQHGYQCRCLILDNREDQYDIDNVQYFHTKHDRTRFVMETDILLSHLNHSELTYYLSKMHRKPFWLVMHNYDDHYFPFICDDKIVKIYNANTTRDIWLAKVPKQTNYTVVRPRFDPEQWKWDNDNVPFERPFITMVNPAPHKGVHVFYQLVKNMPDQMFMLVKGGYMMDQQHFTDYPNLITVEQTDDMANVYHQSKIVLCPSTLETYGMVVKEALLSGCLVLCSDLKCIREHYNDNLLLLPYYYRKGFMFNRIDIPNKSTNLTHVAKLYQDRIAQLNNRKIYDMLQKQHYHNALKQMKEHDNDIKRLVVLSKSFIRQAPKTQDQ